MLFAQERVQEFLLSLLLVVGFAVGLAIHHSDGSNAILSGRLKKVRSLNSYLSNYYLFIQYR